MSGTEPGLVMSILERIAPRLKHPQLFLMLLGLFVVDLVIPDPIPIVDEAVLALLTLLVASWRRKEEPENPPNPPGEGPSSPKDVTDQGTDDGR